MIVPIEPTDGATGRVMRKSTSPRATPPTAAPTMLAAFASIAIRSARKGLTVAAGAVPCVARRIGMASTVIRSGAAKTRALVCARGSTEKA